MDILTGDDISLAVGEKIPPQLRTGNFRFIRVKAKGKAAIDAGWNKDRNYDHTDVKLLKHLVNGGNYGVIPWDNGMCILDADEYTRLEQLGALEPFSGTFTVRTGSDVERYHYFFRCDGLDVKKKIPFFDLTDPQWHLGEVYPARCSAYVVGANCVHPSGRIYQVVNNAPIKTIHIDDLDEIFFSKVKSSRGVRRRDEQLSSKIPETFVAERNALTEQIGLRIDEIAMPVNPVRHGDELQGAHPVHGSTTGMNFSINPTKNVWHCFRCNSGGDPLTWIAVQEGFIRCEDAGQIPIDGDLFARVKEALRTKYGYRDVIDMLDDEYHREVRAGKIQKVNPSEVAKIRLGESIKYTCNLPGTNFMQVYANYVGSTTDAYPEYHYAAALAIISTITGRRAVVKMQQGTVYSNMWIFCLGSSTISRKSTALNRGIEFMININASGQLPSSFTPEALVEVLCDTPRAWLFKDEAGSLLASMQKTYMADIRDLFCELYECKDYRRKLRSGQRKEKTEFHIEKPYVTMLFATTPDNFRSYTTTLDLTSGWLLRFLYFAPRYWKPSMPFTPFDYQTEKHFGELRRWIEGLYEIFHSSDNELEFVLDDDALAYFQEWQCRRETELYERGDALEQSMFGRLVTYALKLAMIFKIGEKSFRSLMATRENKIQKGQYIELEKPLVEEACRQIDEYFLPMAVSMAREVERNESTNLQNKILGVVTRAGGRCPRTKVLRALHVKIRDAEEAFEALVESGEIKQVEVVNEETNRSTIWIMLTEGE